MYVCMEVNKEIKSASEKKSKKKTNNPKFDEFIMKVNVEYFGYHKLQDFKLMKSVIEIVKDVWWNSRRNTWKSLEILNTDQYVYLILSLKNSFCNLFLQILG